MNIVKSFFLKPVKTDVLGELAVLGVGLSSGAIFTTSAWPVGFAIWAVAVILAWKKPWNKK